MQKYILKQQFEGFSVSNSEGLHKGYDMFQSLLSQLEIHGAGVSTEDANQNFLRSLPSSWSQVSLVMRTKPGVDKLSFDDLYNNLRVFEYDVKRHLAVSHLGHEESRAVDEVRFRRDGLEMASSHDFNEIEEVLQEDRRKKAVSADQKEIKKAEEEMQGTQDEPKALVTLDGEGVDWTGHAEAQMSTRDKSGLGYGGQVHNGVLNYENEVSQSVFDSRLSDVEDSPMHDRFANVEGIHAVPPPMTGNYMPSGPDREVDNSMFTYGPKQSKTSESDTQTSNFDSCESNSSLETLESYESDSDDEYVIQPSKEQEKPSFAFVNIVKHVKSPRETAVLSHLIRDCDFHEKTWLTVELNKKEGFSWVFFLRTKDETSGILKDFIRQIENQLNQKVKTIRCDNGTEFKNRDIIEFCGSKGIKREYSNARTPQQNGVAERKNKTLIEAARTMLADSFLPNTFWAEAVSTACYVLNRVLVTKPQNKTPYELITGKIPIISYIRPFGCHVTILNTIDHLGKFEGKSDEGFLVGYSLNSKAFRPVRSENQANKHAGLKEANHSAGTQDNIDAGNSEMKAESAQDYFVLPIWSSYTSTVKSSKVKNEGEKPTKNTNLKTNEKPVDQEDQAFLDELERLKRQEKEANEAAEALRKEFTQDIEDLLLQARAARASSTNTVNNSSTPVSTASPSSGLSYTDLTNTDQDDCQIPTLKDIYHNPNDGIFTKASYDDEGAVADFINLETIKISDALEDESWVDAMQEELLQFKIQKVYILVDLPYGKKAIGTNRFTEIRRMKEVLWLEIRQGWLPRDI
ncbi:retrovirus-related pol polyprotein from transposon TNT 1-94, partial [Tanacetum coccineum]